MASLLLVFSTRRIPTLLPCVSFEGEAGRRGVVPEVAQDRQTLRVFGSYHACIRADKTCPYFMQRFLHWA